jgi:hypothetical protein
MRWLVPVGGSEPATDAAYAGEERDFVTRIADFVQSQASKLVEMAAPMLEVDLA